MILYYFLQFLDEQSTVLMNTDTEITQKIKLMADGLMGNEEMWLTVLAFVAVILLVALAVMYVNREQLCPHIRPEHGGVRSAECR